MNDVLLSVESLPLFAAFNQSLFVYPVVLGIHVLGIAFAVGLLVLVDLRLANVLLRTQSPAEVVDSLRPWFLAGFAAVLVTGTFLFVAQISVYFSSPVFWAKIGLIALAGLNAWYFERHVRQGPAATAAGVVTRAPVLSQRASGLFSLGFWVVAIVLGRLLAYF